MPILKLHMWHNNMIAVIFSGFNRFITAFQKVVPACIAVTGTLSYDKTRSDKWNVYLYNYLIIILLILNEKS